MARSPLITAASLLLIIIGVFLIIDDFVLHWIIWVGPDPFPFTEHWLYGAIMIIAGLVLLRFRD